MFETALLLHCHRFGSFVPTRQPQHLRGPDPHHSNIQRSQPPGRRPLREHHLRAGQWARHGPHESRGPGRPPGTPAQSPPRKEEDQSREPIWSTAGGAVPDPGRPRLCHRRTQRRQNLQVGHNTGPPAALVILCLALAQGEG